MRMPIHVMLRLFDIVAAPLSLLCAAYLKCIRRIGFHRLPLNKKAMLVIGVLPIRDHYAEPLFHPKHLRKSLRDVRMLPALDLNERQQLELLSKFTFASELDELRSQPRDILHFNYGEGNVSFCATDAEYLYNIIRCFKPRNIIEIGSGNSTIMAMQALRANSREQRDYACQHICIEPYEAKWLEETGVTVVREKVEDVDRALFATLKANDILFIDSSHVIRPQGDVIVEYLEILPLLAPGVLIHVHDIFTPRDYLDSWVFDQILFWNEQYLLEAFLSFNNDFRIIGAANFLKHKYFAELSRVCPALNSEPSQEPGSFWMLRTMN